MAASAEDDLEIEICGSNRPSSCAVKGWSLYPCGIRGLSLARSRCMGGKGGRVMGYGQRAGCCMLHARLRFNNSNIQCSGLLAAHTETSNLANFGGRTQWGRLMLLVTLLFL
jgi:hypothetical protein